MTASTVGAASGARRTRQRALRSPWTACRACGFSERQPGGGVRRHSVQPLELQRTEGLWARLTSLFGVHVKSNSKAIGEDELWGLLASLTGQAGVMPSDEEMSLVLAQADRSGDGYISKGKPEKVLAAWIQYLRQRDELAEALARFDGGGTGRLCRSELREYLESIGGDQDVTEQDVDYVMREAAVFGCRELGLVELWLARAAWEKLAARKASVCFSVYSVLSTLASPSQSRLGSV